MSDNLKKILSSFSFVRKVYSYFIQKKLKLWGYGLYDNVNKTTYQKNCLLLYIVDPFKYHKTNYRHQNYEQTKTLTKILAELCYNVDVMQFDDTKVVLHKQYDLIIDVHPGRNNIYKDNMKPNCKKIFYCTGSDPLFLKNAEEQRIQDLYERKGVRIKHQRQVQVISNKEYESLDGMLFMGSTLNVKTYDQYRIKNIFFIKNTGYDFLKNEDFSQKSSKNFLMLSGSGQVEKGLDLLLEIFVKNPDLHLYICSKFMSEKDFVELYHKELFETINIHPIGFIDITSPQFLELSKKCSYILSPSCSEGQSGSVLAGMSAGLIPLISKESGLEENEAYFFEDNKIVTIEKTIREFSKKPKRWIVDNSKQAIKTIQDNHSKKSYYESVKSGLMNIVNN